MWEPVVGLLGMHCEALLCLIVNVLTASGRTHAVDIAYDRRNHRPIDKMGSTGKEILVNKGLVRCESRL